ncbi:MAG: M3 family metallopeptidase [Flavobacteriaceae bacterium]|nr:M3 family metallopeptidase [Flavobacteriaceae bacterium]
MNVLNSTFDTPYSSAPFSKIKDSDFLPAFKQAIKEGKKEIESIANALSDPTFENTIEALDYTAQRLDIIASIFFNLNSAETNDTIQGIAQEVSPLLSEFSNDILLNEKLFKRVKIIFDNQNQFELTTEQKTLLKKKYRSFTRNGANLGKTQKEQLRKIDKELGQLSLKFGENILAETNAFELHIENEADLSGLPEGVIEAAKQLAESKNKPGWIFTLNYPSYVPFITYADNRDLRKKMALAYGMRGFQNNANDNQELVLRIVGLRYQRAKLLGYDSHAHFVLEERMAKSPEKVMSFLKNLLHKAKPAADREFAQLSNFASKRDGITTLEKWDGAYYAEKLKQQLFDLDDEKLKPYFKLEQVIDGVFQVSSKLFDLKFELIENVDTYHKDVITYKVLDGEGNYKSLLYADFFPRPGKRNGAWMTSFKAQFKAGGQDKRPHISIVCNFTKSTKTKPSLLTFNEVRTLFHEFGHALHGMLADSTYPSLSGTNVYWDFVELPSQMLENWCYEEEALKLFATHYETGENMPSELIESIKASSNFMEGMQTVRQISFARLDMSWHATNPSGITNIKQHEQSAFKGTQFYPDCKENCMSTSFSHIFQGGYSSGYYSYKWAEVLDADAFEFFKEKGIFNSEVAKSFLSNILSKGGTDDPMTLYKRFRGQEPKPDALLRRAGLLKS